MARPTKATVDYFPHVTEHGKTLFILENIWGNDGYAAWFKILERLGSSKHHVIDMNDPAESAYTAAYCKIAQETLFAILDQCSALNAINPGLWRKKLIYSQNFVDNVADAYRKRLDKLPSVDTIKNIYFWLFQEETEFPAEETTASDGNPAEETGKEKGKLKNKESKKKVADAPFVLPDYIPQETWKSYLEVRKKKKAAKTVYALNLVIKELDRIKTEFGHDPVAVLNKSITSGWSDVYPLKDQPPQAKASSW